MIADKKSKIFLLAFTLLTVLSIAAPYYRYVALEYFDFFTDEEAFNESLSEE